MASFRERCWLKLPEARALHHRSAWSRLSARGHMHRFFPVPMFGCRVSQVRRDSTAPSATIRRKTRWRSCAARSSAASATSRWSRSASRPCVTTPASRVRAPLNMHSPSSGSPGSGDPCPPCVPQFLCLLRGSCAGQCSEPAAMDFAFKC